MAKKSFLKTIKNESFIFQVLRGMGQIMLQNHALTGVLFLAGIFWGSIWMGIGATLAVLSGTLTAKLFKFNTNNLNQGLYGFSAALVGVALPLFFTPSLPLYGLVVLGGVLATLIQHFFILKKVPVFTLPFVLVTWGFLYTIPLLFPSWIQEGSALNLSTIDSFSFFFKGYGQVIFQDQLLIGILFFLAVYISSPIAAIYGLVGSAITGMTAVYLEIPTEMITNGLLSFNAVLCAIVFAGKKWSDGVYVLISVFIALALSVLFIKNDLPQLTFPFVVGTMLTILVQKIVRQKG